KKSSSPSRHLLGELPTRVPSARTSGHGPAFAIATYATRIPNATATITSSTRPNRVTAGKPSAARAGSPDFERATSARGGSQRFGSRNLCSVTGGTDTVGRMELDTRTEPIGQGPELGSTPRFGYHPALDGLRAAAVLAVIAYHFDYSWAKGGFLGVDTFFVLSGFLISTLLVLELLRLSTLR